MLEGIAIGGGVGLLAVVSVVIAFVMLMRGQQKQNERTEVRADFLAQRLDAAHATNAQLERDASIFKTNEAELRRELGTSAESIRVLEARVTSVQKANADLAETLKQHPGALPAVVASAFDRLRQALPDAQTAAPAPATGDPSRPEAGPVHEGSGGSPSR